MYVLNVRLRLPASSLPRGNCATDIFMLDRALGGSMERNNRGIVCEAAKGLNLTDTLVMKCDIMVAARLEYARLGVVVAR